MFNFFFKFSKLLFAAVIIVVFLHLLSDHMRKTFDSFAAKNFFRVTVFFKNLTGRDAVLVLFPKKDL